MKAVALGLAIPVGALRGRGARHTVEPLDACD